MAGQKIEQGRAHTQWRDDRGNVAFRAFGETIAAHRTQKNQARLHRIRLREKRRRGGNASAWTFNFRSGLRRAPFLSASVFCAPDSGFRRRFAG